MAGGDSSLNMILTELVSYGSLTQMDYAVLNHRLVPIRTILLPEAKDVSLRVYARGQARSVQEHQGHQSVSARLIGRRMLGKQGCQANRFVAEFLLHQAIAAGRLVPFVKEQIESLQDTVQSARQLFAGRDLERNAQLADFLPGSREALRNGGFGGEECLRDLRDAKSAKSFKGEGRLCLLRNERMATGKHQSQTAIFNFSVEKWRITSGGVG